MDRLETKGKVVTVLGAIEPISLGRTLTHEHVSLDFRVAYTPPADAASIPKTGCEFTMPNLGWIRQNPYSHHKNIQLCGDEVESLVEEEFHRLAKAGGGTVVENTSIGIKRNIGFMKRLSHNTGIHMIAGTGFYVDGSHSPTSRASRIACHEIMCADIKTDMTLGCPEDETVMCGLLGEVGCSWPLTEFERHSVKATGEVQEELGCPVMFHPGRHHDAPKQILKIYAEAGGNIDKAVMGHLDRTIHTMEELEEFATMGSYLEYDLFGVETSHYQLQTTVDMPSDAQRITRIKHLTEAGYGDKILLSHDIHTRHRLTAYGGHGYSHILENVVPKMLARGISSSQVDAFLKDNPHRWLTFTK